MQFSYENQPEDEFLPEHTQSMRKALQYCHQLVQDCHQNHSLPPPLLSCNKVATLVDGSYKLTPRPVIEIDPQATEAAHRIQEQRQQALTQFWKRQQEWLDCCGIKQGKEDGGLLPAAVASFKSCNSSDEVVQNMVIDTIDMASSSSRSSSSPPPTVVEFRQKYQNANQPCLIRGLDKTAYFSSVCSKWRQQSNEDTTHDNHGPKNYLVNKDWFRMTIGGDTMVPVRFQPFSSTHSDANALDEEGRAEECKTKNMTLDQWMELLEQSGEKEFYEDHYLKDWHLQSFLRDRANQYQPERITATNTSHTEPCLYEVPPYFEHDILNDFLTRFTQKGDYKFTYWGPKGSRTSLHSDVMNSYSWSFNVRGTKEWKFYPPQISSSESSTPSNGDEQQNPPSPSNPTKSESAALVVVQHAGECIFVPCGWTHEVTNLEESLSINHNWITTGNIDQTWDCLCQEMKAIETELKAWSIDESCWDARESMLRGCVGLDVSAFFLMILTRLLELLLLSLQALEYTGGNGIGSDDTNTRWTLHFDMARLKEALRTLFCPQDDDVNIENRLSTVLQSGEASASAVTIAVWAMESIS